jgi:hypothetical protein
MFLGLEPLWRTPRRQGRFVPFDQAVANAGRSSSYWARSSGMKRCCDIRLPF